MNVRLLTAVDDLSFSVEQGKFLAFLGQNGAGKSTTINILIGTQEGMHQGFEPVFDSQSRVLISGSFPSVKSREVGFYYGNKQNRFWKMLSQIFEEVQEKAQQ